MTKKNNESSSVMKEMNKQSLKTHIDTLLLASASYDKAILSLSVATLGFTFAFMRFVEPGHRWVDIDSLYLSWISLVLSIIFILIVFVFDQIHSAHRIEFYRWSILKDEKDYENGSKFKDEDKKLKHWTDKYIYWTSIYSGIFYVIGIIIFTVFAGKNICI